MTEETLLSVRNLTLTIPTGSGILHAVRGIDFDLKRGETLSIVGESGSGKSLTSLAVMGLLSKGIKREADEMRFDQTDLRSASPKVMRDLRGNRMAMIFQEPMTSLNPAYTIGDQLIETLRLHRRVSKAKARDRAIELLEKVGITAAASRLGQYPEPDLLIADEPTTALDVTIQAQILRLLVDLTKEMNMAMILITHDLGVVARVADKVAVMYAGELVETGPAKDIFAAPSHPYTRGLLRCIPQPGKTERGAPLGTIPGIVPSLIGEVTGCAFRTRCAHAQPACREAIPHHGDAAHRFRCIHPDGARSAETAEGEPV